MKTHATETQPTAVAHLRMRISKFCLFILAAILTLAPTTRLLAQDTYDISSDLAGNLYIVESSGSNADHLEIDFIAAKLTVHDDFNTFNVISGGSLLLTGDGTSTILVTGAVGDIFVDMGDGMDKLTFGETADIPDNVDVTSIGDLEIVGAAVDANLFVTAENIDVVDGGSGIVVDGSVALLTALGTITIDEPVATTSVGSIELQGSIIVQQADIVAAGPLVIRQPSDNLTDLLLTLDPTAFFNGSDILIGESTLGGGVTIQGHDIDVIVPVTIRSGTDIDFSSINISVGGGAELNVVAGASGDGSNNFLGGIDAQADAHVFGGAGADAFTFGGVVQSLDFALSPISIDGMDGEDITILDDGGDSDDNVYTVLSGSVERNVDEPTITYSNIERLEINAGDGEDNLVVDLSGSNPFDQLTLGLDFDGGGQPPAKNGGLAIGVGDAITLQGGVVANAAYEFVNASSGSIFLDGDEITYSGLEPIFDNLIVADRVFTFLGGDESIILEDDGSTNDLSRILSTLGETVIFTNPALSLTVNTGSGDDILTMTDLDGNFDMHVPVVINGGVGGDTFTIDLLPPFTAPVEVHGEADADLFIVTPRVGSTTIKGGDPTTYPGDVLDLDLDKHGAVIESFISAAPDDRDGTWTFVGALDDIVFTNIEEQLDYSDVKVKIVVNDAEPTVGSTVIYTVTAKNLLPGHSTGLKLNVPVSTMGQRFLKAEADFGEFDPATGVWTIGELKDSEKATLEIHSQIRVFRQLTMFAEVLEVDQFDPNSTPNNMALGENDYDQVLVSPNPVETPGPNDFFRPTSVEGTSFATLGVSPHDPTAKSGPSTNYLFAGSTDGGLHRSTDGGANWPRVGLKDKIIRAMSVSSLTGAIYVGDYGEGMYRSVDDGLTFVDINSGIPVGTGRRVIASALDEFAPRSGADGDVYIGTDGGGIFLSEDDGATWTAINTGLGKKIVRALLVVEDGSGGNKEQIYAGTLGGGVYTLKEGETTWTAANGTGSVKLGDRYVYALAKSQLTDAIYAGTGDGIYKTLDNGATWTLVKADTPTRAFATYVKSGTEYIFAGTDGAFVQVSTDGGATWFEQNIGLDDRTVEVVLATEDGILFAGTATQGIFRSDDLGANWYRVTSFMQNAVIQAMTFDDAGELYVGTYGFGVFHTDDAMNFTRVNTGLDNHWVFALAHTPGDALFAGTWNKGVYRSVDDARTWQFVGLPYRNVYDFAVRDEYTIYAATDRGEVARSVDNGLTWHEVGVATTAIYALAIDPVDPNVVYAGTFGAGTYKSTDGAHSFTKTGMPDTHVFDFAFDPLTGDLWAATSTGPMFSADGGTTWTTLVGGLDNVDTRAIVFNDIAVPLIGTWGGGVSRYDDLADEWVEYGMTDMPILAFAISPVDGDLYAGTDGMGVFRRSFGVITGREKEEPLAAELPTDYALGQNYPNPFNPVTTISFDMPESGSARLAVYDMVGREVRVVVDGSLKAGRHEVRMDAADLPSGIYMYRLDANGQSFAKKMVLMK